MWKIFSDSGRYDGWVDFPRKERWVGCACRSMQNPKYLLGWVHLQLVHMDLVRLIPEILLLDYENYPFKPLLRRQSGLTRG